MKKLLIVLDNTEPIPRLIIGLFLCGLAAVYCSLIPIALTGTWTNNLMHGWDNSLLAVVLGITNACVLKWRRFYLANYAFALLYLAFAVVQFVATRALADLPFFWPILVTLVVMPGMNAWLFSKWLDRFPFELLRAKLNREPSKTLRIDL